MSPVIRLVTDASIRTITAHVHVTSAASHILKQMKTLLLLLLSAFLSLNLRAADPAPAADDGFVSLFNGKDLSGWVNVNTWQGVKGRKDTWGVTNGVITCTGQPTGFMRSEKHYENFVLELEWRHLKAAGNSGVFVWASPKPAGAYAKAVEVQILDLGYTEQVAKGGGKTDWFTCHGDVFAIHGMRMIPFPPTAPNPASSMRSFPSENRTKPTPEWNHYRITALHGTVLLAVNGKEVSGGYNCSVRKGYLALESEGSPIEFRNIRIKEWPSTHPKPEEIAPLADAAGPGVEGEFQIQAQDKTIAGVTLLGRLYEFDPRLADAPATLVDKVEVANVAHTTGKATTVKFALGAKVTVKADRRYYVTVHGYSEGKVASNEHYVYYGTPEKGDLAHVFTDGKSSAVKFTGKRLKD